jgi:hypothetical protein
LADLEVFPRDVRGDGPLAGEDEDALALVVAFDVEVHLGPDDGLDVLELGDRNDALALAAEVDEHVVLADRDDPPAPRSAALLGLRGRAARLGLVGGIKVVEAHPLKGGGDLTLERLVLRAELFLELVAVHVFGHGR